VCCIYCNTTSNWKQEKDRLNPAQHPYRKCWRLPWWCEVVIHWQQERGTMGSPPSSAKVQNEWSYNSAPPICLHSVGKENLTFYFIHRKIVKRLKVFEIVCRKDNLDHKKQTKYAQVLGILNNAFKQSFVQKLSRIKGWFSHSCIWKRNFYP
jgi:hypothetical protein